MDCAFEKYYSLERIQYLLGEYRAKRINDRLLRNWAHAYNWILMSGFKVGIQQEENNITVKEMLIYQLSDWLDSLSFFHEDWEVDIRDYEEVFSTLDEIYRNTHEWCVEYAPTNEFCEENGDVWVLFVNENKRTYLKICYQGYGEYTVEGLAPLTVDKLKNTEKQLKAKGYQEMPFGTWEE